MHALCAAIDQHAALADAPALRRALRSRARALVTEGRARLPRVEGLGDLLLARWLQRLLCQAEDRFVPLVHVRAAWLTEAALASVQAQAAGGLLLLEGAADALPRLPGVATLGDGDGPNLPAPRAFVERLRWEDHHHDLSVDPALGPLRRSLLAHCRAASVVHLQGEPGTGGADLARWAHGQLDDRPLCALRGDEGRAEPGAWLLVDGLEDLSPRGRSLLVEALRARQPKAPPPPPPRGPPRRPPPPARAPLIRQSPALAALLHRAAELAPSRLPLLILGAPGTGKESLARAVHAMSGRRGPLVALDLGALPEHLAESALFGHVRGAFTGAEQAREGVLRAADGGTVFLDELGNLPAGLQAKLLRALQEGRVRPVGADREQPVDVRVVAATNADLDAMVREGRFRPDLLGRLDAATLRLPPLGERAGDVRLLARHLLGRARGEGAPGFTAEAMALLEAHDWPGNVRELGHVVALAAATTPDGQPVPPEALGHLAPGVRRETPLLVASLGDEAAWGLDRGAARAVQAVTLRVPPLRARGPLSVRARVLAALGGRPILDEALRRLESQPWWGNEPQLQAALRALTASAAGPVDEEALDVPLPRARGEASRAPLRALLGPVELPDGRVGGLHQDFDDEALLVGRAGSLAALRAEARLPDGARLAASLQELDGLLQGRKPGLLSLAMISRLSRAHLLITRGEGGLLAHALRHAALPLEAAPLGEVPREVRPGHPAPLGEAGELLVRGAGGVLLQVFVFVGEVACAERGHLALEATRRGEGAAGQTLLRTLPPPPPAGPLWQPSAPSRRLLDPPPPPPEAPPRRRAGARVWTLDAAEARALADLLAEHPGGQFGPWIEERLPALRADPGLSRLTHFLERAPRAAQYVARLLQHPDNGPARAAAAAALRRTGQAQRRLAGLPSGLRDALAPHMAPLPPRG